MKQSLLITSAIICFIISCGFPAFNYWPVSGNVQLQTATPSVDHPKLVNPFEIFKVKPEPYSRVLYGRTGEELALDGPIHWLDVDLGEQVVYAYEDSNVVRKFIASTGTRFSPTIIGQFRAYEFHDSTYMQGEGFYFPRVRYVIYFYKGYSFHAADWHDNFGEPMSHGCVNLREEDAAWLFQWAKIGTLINIHY